MCSQNSNGNSSLCGERQRQMPFYFFFQKRFSVHLKQQLHFSGQSYHLSPLFQSIILYRNVGALLDVESRPVPFPMYQSFMEELIQVCCMGSMHGKPLVFPVHLQHTLATCFISSFNVYSTDKTLKNSYRPPSSL